MPVNLPAAFLALLQIWSQTFLQTSFQYWPGVIEGAARDLESRDRSVRTQAVERLAAVDSEPARALLRGVLDDPDPSLRQAGARILAARGDRQGLSVVIGWVATGFAADRAAGLEALRLLPSLPGEARAVVERALADPEPNIRLAALDVLTLAPPGIFSMAAAGRLTDTVPAVRLAAVRLAAQAGDPRAALPLLEALGDADRQIQREAIAALARLGDPRAEPALLRLIDGGSDDLRLAAVDAVGALRLGGAVDTLAPIARRRPADALARQAQRALGEIGTAGALAVLIELMRRPPVSRETEDGLSRWSNLLPLLLDEIGEAGPGAASAAAVVGRLREVRAVPALIRLVRRGGSATAMAVRALGAIRSTEAIPALVEAAEDRSAIIRRHAFAALLDLGDERGVAVLAAGLVDRDADVRVLAARMAGRLGARAFQAAVQARLFDTNPQVRNEAVSSLALLGAPGAARPLVAALPLLRGLELRVGATLAVVARAADLPLLLRAARSARGAARLALLMGLQPALEDGVRQPGAQAAIELLAAELAHGGVGAELAADALTGAAPAVGVDDRALRLIWQAAAAPVRARLCAALASSPDGRLGLARVLLYPRESGEVQAAAAWALAGTRDPALRRALDWASNSAHPAVAANARAALAATARPRGASLRLRLLGATEAPVEGRWMIAHLPAGPVWFRTGGLGQARLPHAGAAPLRLEPGEPDLRLRRTP
jgi:HEAT repeat protein